MAKTLSKTGISTSNTIQAWHVTQSIDVLTSIDAYNISISGSLVITGSTNISGSLTAISMSGDGSSLTGITAEWDGSHNGNASITGSLILSGSGIGLNVLGNITASGDISGSGTGSFAQLGVDTKIGDPSDLDTYIDFGSNADRIDFYAGGERLLKIAEDGTDEVVIGDGGDVNFRVATAGYGHNLYVKSDNAGGINNSVGIRTTSPKAVLDVSGSIFASGINGHITASGNISASGDIYAEDYFINGTQFTDYSTLANHFAIGAQGGGSLILTNITASGYISASGIIYTEGLRVGGDAKITGSLITSGSRVKHFREVTLDAWADTPSIGIESEDEIIFITQDLSSTPSATNGNIAISTLLTSDVGRTVELSIFGGSGNKTVILRYTGVGTWNVNGSDPSNNTYSATNMTSANIGSFIKITNLGNKSASIWGTGIYP